MLLQSYDNYVTKTALVRFVMTLLEFQITIIGLFLILETLLFWPWNVHVIFHLSYQVPFPVQFAHEAYNPWHSKSHTIAFKRNILAKQEFKFPSSHLLKFVF